MLHKITETQLSTFKLKILSDTNYIVIIAIILAWFTFEQSSEDLIMQVRQHLYAPPTPSLKPPTRPDAGVSPRNTKRYPLNCFTS